jgi:hypothetical protein
MALDKQLPKVVQYIKYIPRNPPEGDIQMDTPNILEEYHSLIKAVQISSLKDLNNNILLKRVWKPINHITIMILRIEMTADKPHEQQKNLNDPLNCLQIW